MNFVTIASQLKPYDNVKLCGYRRRVKFITTYNNVLINLDVGMIKEISAGFSLTYKVIMTPSDCKWIKKNIIKFFCKNYYASILSGTNNNQDTRRAVL